MSVSRNERRPRSELKRVLVVDDEADIRELIDLTLLRMGLTAVCAGSVAEARAALASHDFQLCLTDMRLPDGDGLDIVRHIGEAYAHLPVAVITAYGSAENAVAALKAGAFDYLAKPIGLEQLRNLVQAALRLPGTEEAVGTAEQEGPELLGASPAMQQVRAMIEKLARSQAPVYISGESGSGKEVAARLIHARSARSAGPFVPVNCGAIPENLMESEFFGYRKGAFTGADSDRDGFFQAAHGGTLFLDEVADLPLPMQVKLLRAIQEKKVRKVGQVSEEPVDLRILCATHRNLRECVESGTFRQDLYYRLNVIELRMPPLRERSEDIEALAGRILKRLAGPEHPLLSAQALVVLMAYAFPGNVRELENILERATALCAEGVILPEDLQLETFAAPGGAVAADAMNWSAPARQAPLADRLRAIESALLRHVMSEAADNAEQAAESLHVSVESLQARLARNA
ncbi:MAG: sigma-54 dependent transcriptional regulator [Azonexus sp.]|nr:sigma-54 dependent transcriptional regulator [Azonexus sp.]